jgi:hypothetical protein
MSHRTPPGSGCTSLYALLGIAGALVGAGTADALGIAMIIGAIFGAAFFVIGWRQMQPP